MRNRSTGPRPPLQPGTRLGLLLAALLLGGSAAAQSPTLYRWVDKDGHVHYDDAGTAPGAKAVNPRLLGGDSPAGAPDTGAAAAKQAECKAKADDYNRFKTAAGITETDALGNAHTYSPEEKDKLVARKRQDLVALCGAAAADAPPPAPAAPAAAPTATPAAPGQ
jgi:hypothetical protein